MTIQTVRWDALPRDGHLRMWRRWGSRSLGSTLPPAASPGGGFSPVKGGGWLPRFLPSGALGTRGAGAPSHCPEGWLLGTALLSRPRSVSPAFQGSDRPLPSLRGLNGLEMRPDAGETRSHFPLVKVTPRISNGHTYCPASGGGGRRRTAVRGRCAPVCGGSVPLHLGASRPPLPGGQQAGHGEGGTGRHRLRPSCTRAVLVPSVPASPLEMESVLSRFLTYFLLLSAPRCIAFFPRAGVGRREGSGAAQLP